MWYTRFVLLITAIVLGTTTLLFIVTPTAMDITDTTLTAEPTEQPVYTFMVQTAS